MLQTEPNESALSSEEVRRQLYEIAGDARLCRLVVDEDDDATMIALARLMKRVEDRLVDIAGGSTFDRLRKLEEKAVAS